jgi:hypothetical protein
MQAYRQLMQLSNVASVFRYQAYEELGKALHPVMDSTSPMHEGWQVWHMLQDWVFHGNAHGSLEGLGALTSDKMQQTKDLIDKAMSGESCGCLFQ